MASPAETPDRPRRILFFDDRHYAAQGAQRVLVDVASFAQDAGHDVTVGTTREGALLELARSRGLKTTALGTPAALDQWGGMLSGGLTSRLRLLPPLLHQNLRIARIVRRDGYEVVWAAAMRPTLSLVLTALLTRAAVVWHVMSNAYFPIFNELASLAARRIVLIADTVHPAVGRLRDKGLVRKRIRTLPAGVAAPPSRDFSREEFVAATGIGAGALNKTWVISVGGYVPEKGHLDVVQAVGSLPEELQEHLFVLIGGPHSDSEYGQQVAKTAAEVCAETSLHDWVSDVDAWMRAADIFVLASSREGMPLVLIEAMQRGAVAVSYDVGAVRELIRTGENGVVVPQGSVPDLAQTIKTLAGSADRRADIRTQATEFIENHHTIEHMRRTFISILNDIVEPRRGAST